MEDMLSPLLPQPKEGNAVKNMVEFILNPPA